MEVESEVVDHSVVPASPLLALALHIYAYDDYVDRFKNSPINIFLVLDSTQYF